MLGIKNSTTDSSSDIDGVIMEIGKVSLKGKLTIPQKLLKKYGIKPGTKLICRDESNGIKIISAVTYEEVYSNIGFVKTKRNLIKSLIEEKKRERRL
jgi:bifunctional DNA-binding transcriptional regulator/antitoxin component of YhaV-PrlF toxin-antitoxin module